MLSIHFKYSETIKSIKHEGVSTIVRELIQIDTAYSFFLKQLLDINDAQDFPATLRKAIKKDQTKYQLHCSECRKAPLIYAKGELREYFREFNIDHDGYKPHQEGCSHRSSIEDISKKLKKKLGNNLRILDSNDRILLDFSNFFEPDIHDLEQSEPNGLASTTKGEGKKRTRTTGQINKTIIRRKFSTFAQIADFFRTNLTDFESGDNEQVQIKSSSDQVLDLNELFLNGIRTYLELLKQSPLRGRFFYGRIWRIKQLEDGNYRITLSGHRLGDTDQFLRYRFFVKKTFMQQILNENIFPSEGMFIFGFGDASLSSYDLPYINVNVDENCLTIYPFIAKDGHYLRSKFEMEIDNFLYTCKKLSRFKHIVPGSKDATYDQWNEARCKREFNPDSEKYEFFIPDFILNDGQKTIIVECFGFDAVAEEPDWLPQQEYRKKKEYKNEYFRSLPGYDYIPVTPDDVKWDNAKLDWYTTLRFFESYLNK